VECKKKVIPIITWGTGTISKSLRQYLSNIPGKHEINELEETNILGTAHITWGVLMQKYRSLTWEITLHVP
jgi:hypothetical protein